MASKPRPTSPSLVDHWRHRRPPNDVRAQFLHALQAHDMEEKQRLDHELVRLMQQINTLLAKEHSVLPAYHRKDNDDDPRRVFYYHMLRRVGLPAVHARFAPWFLQSHQLVLNRWSTVLFARLERAFFACPEQRSTLESRMRGHQRELDQRRTPPPPPPTTGHARVEPRQWNQRMLQRAFRDCSFFHEATRHEGPKAHVPVICDRAVDETQDEIDKLESIDAVPVQPAPPGLAPPVPGSRESHGKHVYVTYHGRWKHGEMHGPVGVYTFADGGTYRGEWRASHPHGAGVMVYPNGVKYTGEFVAGKFHGFGVMECARGFVYEGAFNAGKRCGHGKLRFSWSDTFYEGEFYDNQRHGQGTETNALGYAYTGAWRQNRMCGPGRLVCPDQREVVKQEWPMCVLGEAIRLVKSEQCMVAEQQEQWYRRLLRVRDDLRVQDLQYAWWDQEAERMERAEAERIAGLKQARREKRETVAAAKQAFLEQKMKDQEEEEEEEVEEEEEEEEEEAE